MAFSLVLGDVADELRAATIPVVDDLTRLGEPPDVIHGHHHIETLIAALAFPATPIVNFCHGWVPWEEMPLITQRSGATWRSTKCASIAGSRGRNRARADRAAAEFRRPRSLSSASAAAGAPERALVLSNAATADGYARAIAAACQSAGIVLDIVGGASAMRRMRRKRCCWTTISCSPKGGPCSRRWRLDARRSSPTGPAPGRWSRRRTTSGSAPRNFGIRELQHAHDVAWYRQQIARYAAVPAADVSRRVRDEAGMQPAVDRLIAIYAAAMAAPPGPGEPRAPRPSSAAASRAD